MKLMKEKLRVFSIHDDHVIYHKQQMEALKDNLPVGNIIVKADFIQNILHQRGRETASSHFGKRQTQLLVFCVWFRSPDTGVVQRRFYDYLSSYLAHNSLFFQKCVRNLLNYLIDEEELEFTKVCMNI